MASCGAGVTANEPDQPSSTRSPLLDRKAHRPSWAAEKRAFQTLPYGLLSLTWIDGMALIHRKLEATLEALGLEPIEVEPGQPFDPLVHAAITREAHGDLEEGQVIAEVQRGYRLGERLLRPTLVRVSSGPAEKADLETSADETASVDETASADAASSPDESASLDAAASEEETGSS